MSMIHHLTLNVFLPFLRNAFDDDREKENEIEILTKQITRGFHKCQNSIKLIGQRAKNSSTQQQRMAANIMSSLATTLQVPKLF